MKTLFSFTFCLLCMSVSIIPQQASDYFPASTGFTWSYVVTPLDSANNAIDPLAFYRADSFAVIADYNGMMANIVYSKSGDINSLPSQSYDDSLFYHFEAMNAFEFTQVGNEEFLLRTLDSLQIDPNFSFLDFFTSLEDWYSMYRFEQPVNSEYEILSVDTTLNNGILTLPLRFEYSGMKLNDEVIETQIGTMESKKFLIIREVGLILSPTVTIPLVSIEDTLWMASGKWILKRIVPSTYVDLTLIGANWIFVPGLKTDIIQSLTDVEETAEMPQDYFLSQNYPNPFNPVTNIQFRITNLEFVSLKVFDILGNEAATLINEEMPAGTHQVYFNARNLASGTYYYRLQAGEFTDIKKMIFLK